MADDVLAAAPEGSVDTPAWVRDAVFYQIFPDRFARSARVPKPNGLEPWEAPPTTHGYKGGDLLGIVERLDYLEELGVNALYLNPVFQSASNHRYHTHDYHRVDPMLGGDAALRELLDAAHARGMRVVLDGVFNHASRGFFQFSDILENGAKSPYLDWFHVRRFPLNAFGEGELGYAAWWNLAALPKFNTDTPAVREFLWDVATRWLEFGIDGWRLDVPNEIDDDPFWREFRRRCRAVNPDCYLVGEIWTDAERWLRGDQFDAVMNYPFARAAFGFVAHDMNEGEAAKSGLGRIPRLDAGALAAELTALLQRHPRAVTEVQLNLLGSHDTPRARTVLGGDEAALRLATTLQMTFPGAPCVYYGDELGLEGGHDPHCRQGMPWDQLERDPGPRPWFRHLIGQRRAHRTLRTGAFTVLHAAGELLAYARHDNEGAFVVVLNAGDSQARLDLPVGNPEALAALAGSYRDAFGGLELRLEDGRLRGLDVPARSGVVYRREG